MDNLGSLLVTCVVSCAIIALCLVCAWNYWHGRWLRSISGNTFATDEELESPYQKRIGKRVAIVLLICAAGTSLMLTISVTQTVGGSTATDIISFIGALFTAVMIGSCVWICLLSWRDQRALKDDIIANNPARAKEYTFDKRLGIVLIAIILSVVVIELVVIPLVY